MHAHPAEEITEGRMFGSGKQLSLKVMVLGLPVILCLHCADCYSFTDINTLGDRDSLRLS